MRDSGGLARWIGARSRRRRLSGSGAITFADKFANESCGRQNFLPMARNEPEPIAPHRTAFLRFRGRAEINRLPASAGPVEDDPELTWFARRTTLKFGVDCRSEPRLLIARNKLRKQLGSKLVRDFVGRTAFVTGGANGIGFALSQAFAEAGLNVVLADIEQGALTAAVERLRDFGSKVQGIICDVADPVSVENAAAKAFERFGQVHVLCNNAGVAGGSGIEDISVETWRWVVDVNLMGVVYGVRSFLPRMIAHGERCHIVNTASMAGLENDLGFSPYAATKFAVVSMSEGLAKQLRPLRIGVTVLCPGFVQTQISESARNRPIRYGPSPALDPKSAGGILAAESARLQRLGLDPSAVAKRTLQAIQNDELYVFTHPDMNERVKKRFAVIEAAMDQATTR